MKKGFTLIEILVTLALVLMISLGTFSYINSYNSRNSVSQASKDIRRIFLMARNYAVTRQLPKGLSGDMGYVRLKFDQNIFTSYVADTGSSYRTDELGISGIEIIPSESNWQIDFETSTGRSATGLGLTTVPRNTDIGLTIRSETDHNNRKEILIKPNGMIEMR